MGAFYVRRDSTLVGHLPLLAALPSQYQLQFGWSGALVPGRVPEEPAQCVSKRNGVPNGPHLYQVAT